MIAYTHLCFRFSSSSQVWHWQDVRFLYYCLGFPRHKC